jgi:large subunit ribosomal protein L4
MAVLSKIQDRQILIIDGLDSSDIKTKTVAAAFAALQRPDIERTDAENKTRQARQTLATATLLFGLPEHDPKLYLSARNISGVKVSPVGDFNALDVLKQRYLVLTREAFLKLKSNADRPITRRPNAAVEV